MINRWVTYRVAPRHHGRVEGWILVAAALLGLALAGCGDESFGPVCTLQAVFGINLRVMDGSGGPLAQGSLGVAVDGAYTETLLVLGDADMVGAVERPGTYDVTVSRPGYATWSAGGLVVTADECHVRPIQVDANLILMP